MTESEDKRFDLQIRSVLGNAREEVPEGLWAGIEQRLDGKGTSRGRTASVPAANDGKTRVIPLWFRIASGTAVAAALAAGIFLSGIFDDTVSDFRYDRLADSGDRQDIMIKDAGASVIVADIPAAGDLYEMTGPARPSVTDQKQPAENVGQTETSAVTDQEQQAGTESQEETPMSGTEDTAVISGQEPAGKESAAADDGTSAEQPQNTAEYDADAAAQWEKFMNEESSSRRRPKAALTLSGNAISNTNASASGRTNMDMAFLPGKNELTEDIISESSESSYSVPVSVGVGVKIDFTERWALSAGVNYSHLRRTFAGNYFDVHDDGTFTETGYSNILNRQDYIGIPVNVYFSIMRNSFLDFYAYAGGTAEKCVSNRFTAPDDRSMYLKEPVKGFQFSANVGLGMEFIIARTFGIYVDPSLRYYFPDSRQPRSIRTAQPLMFGLELGVRIHL